MANYTSGDTRPILQQADLAVYQGNGSLVLDSRRTRPLWFDGRFLDARDFAREQNYFLQREADLARAPGFRTMRGLQVATSSTSGQSSSAQAITISAGNGVTPAGELVTLPSAVTLQLSELVEEENLDVQFGVSTNVVVDPATRTGLYILAIKPVQFTANPITAYPTTVQGPRTIHDGDLVEATAVTLVPYPGPSNGSDAASLQAALGRQIFVTGNSGSLPDSLLPLAMLSLQGGAIEWIDSYMVRRETGVEFNGLQFGLTDPATQQAFLLEYDSRLQQVVGSFVRQNLPARFAATDHFQALPPSGRFPLSTISTSDFTQLFFPAQMDVRLSIVPDDELAALLQDSMSLPPIDLTLDPTTYEDLTILALVPIPRAGFAALAAQLPAVKLTTVLPQVLNNRRPFDLLQFYRGVSGIQQPSGTDNSSWQTAFGTQTYGYYIRARSAAPVVNFTTLVPIVLTGITPNTAVAGSPEITVTVSGSGFNSKAAVIWNGTALDTTFVSAEQLTAIVPANLLITPGTFSISVSMPDEVSPQLSFVVTQAPAITSLSPSSVVAQEPAFTLTVTGTAFTAASVVFLNNTSLTTKLVSANSLTAAVTADLIKLPGSVLITVQGSGRVSNALPLTITSPPPPLVLTSISPTTINAGGPTFQLQVNGSGFSSISVITLNGVAIQTAVLSGGLMEAVIAASQVASPGTLSVGVSAPNLTSPPPLTLTISPPPLVLSSITPKSAVAGSAAFSLAVAGSGFSAASVATWNGTALPTTFVSSVQLTAAVPATLVATASEASVIVTAPNQTASAPLTFLISPKQILVTGNPIPTPIQNPVLKPNEVEPETKEE